MLVAPNLGWKDFPLRDSHPETGSKLPATLDNDANCATFGEWWQGAARGGTNVVGMTIGTGIGGGIILERRAVSRRVGHGGRDRAHDHRPRTAATASAATTAASRRTRPGPAIATRAREVLVREETSIADAAMVDGKLDAITAQTVYDAAKEGDAVASEIVRDTARYLGAGIANLLNIFNPDVVVIAGGVTQAGEALFVPLRAEVRRRAFKPGGERCAHRAG